MSRPLELHYFECSLKNCYGLPVLHKYFRLPFLYLKRETLRQQLKVVESDLAQVKHQVSIAISEQRYNEYVEFVTQSNIDVKTGRPRTTDEETPAEMEEQVTTGPDEDLPERRSSTAELKITLVPQEIAKPQQSEPVCENLEDFRVSESLDAFYSSDEGSEADPVR